MPYVDSLPPCQHNPARAKCGTCRKWATDEAFRDRVTQLNARAREGRGKLPPKAKGPPAKPPGFGPGTELTKIAAKLKIPGCWQCALWSDWMDWIGVEGCEVPENFDAIVANLRDKFGRLKRYKKARVIMRTARTTLPFRVKWSDPFPGVLREAIRRASHA